MPRPNVRLAALLLALGTGSGLPSGASAAEDPCAAFSWNVSHERALFATSATSLAAGGDAASMPALSPDHFYDLGLLPQDQVRFRAAPGKKGLTDGAYAGLVRFRVSTAGLYRISLDQAFWIDVVQGNQLISSSDFQGRPGCKAPHKIVQFVLPAGQDLTLQLSGAVSPHVRITITPAQ